MWFPRDLAHLREPLAALLRNAASSADWEDAATIYAEDLDLARAILGTREDV